MKALVQAGGALCAIAFAVFALVAIVRALYIHLFARRVETYIRSM